MKLLLLIAFTVVAGASIGQTGDNTITSKPTYQQTVAYLQEKLNSLATSLRYGGSDKYCTEYFSDFKISKNTDGDIFLKLKRTEKYSGENNAATRIYHITIPISDFIDINFVTDCIQIATSGETIAEFCTTSNIAGDVNRTFYFKIFRINLRMETQNTLEKLKRAFLNLKSYCPQPKKDIFDN